MTVLHNRQVLLFPRPNDDGQIAIRVALVTSWAPSTERDAKYHTDIWSARKITVAMPFSEVTRLITEALGDA